MAIHLLTGNDESLLRNAASDLVRDLVGEGDRSMMVDEFEGEEYELRLVVDAAQTPPFLTDKRVVVARTINRFKADDLPALLDYLERPLDTTDLVLVAGGPGQLSRKLADAVKKAGTVTSTGAPAKAGDRRSWFAEQVAATGVTLDGRALQALGDWLGEDVGRLDGILHTLLGTYGPGVRLSWADVEPFLGEAGGVPPWEFTDAIAAGDTTRALTLLGRMLHGGGRHPLQVMATLHHHYAALARLDGAGARTEQDAATATGLKGFPAKKALEQSRRLGQAPVKRALELLARADLDLRGGTDLDAEVVMEVLVARLSKLR
jgi:DNA polymerase-3 subunit delta